MRKIGDDKFDVAKQEELMLKFLWAIGKFKNLMVLAEKLLEFKKQITLKWLEEDKKEDEEEKTEEADKKDSIEVSLDAIESLEE